MNVLTYTDARANLKTVMDHVVEDRAEVIVTRQAAGAVVILSLDEWNAVQETMHLLSSRRNASRLHDSIRQLERGEAAERELVDA